VAELLAIRAGAATFASNCAACHGATGTGGTSGERVAGEDAHELYEAMQEGEDDMPRFLDLTYDDAKNMAAYLHDPAAASEPLPGDPPVTPPPVDPPADPPAGPAPVTPTYRGAVKAILDSACAACHQGANAPARVRLDSFTAASASASASLSAVQAGRMPPGGPLPAAQVQVIADWIAGGKPQ
jgi:mono/diheme cytochrome c family protein